jgi:hypothetical protein
MSVFDIILFHIIFGLIFVVYLTCLFIYFREYTVLVLLATYILYICTDGLQAFIAWVLSERKRADFHLFPLFSYISTL